MVFQSTGAHIIRTPVRAPNANAFAERWVRTVRHECLDKIIVLNEAHLRQVLKEYVGYYNTARPHQGIEQQMPIPNPISVSKGEVRSHPVLSGIIHNYYRAA